MPQENPFLKAAQERVEAHVREAQDMSGALGQDKKGIVQGVKEIQNTIAAMPSSKLGSDLQKTFLLGVKKRFDDYHKNGLDSYEAEAFLQRTRQDAKIFRIYSDLYSQYHERLSPDRLKELNLLYKKGVFGSTPEERSNALASLNQKTTEMRKEFAVVYVSSQYWKGFGESIKELATYTAKQGGEIIALGIAEALSTKLFGSSQPLRDHPLTKIWYEQSTTKQTVEGVKMSIDIVRGLTDTCVDSLRGLVGAQVLPQTDQQQQANMVLDVVWSTLARYGHLTPKERGKIEGPLFLSLLPIFGKGISVQRAKQLYQVAQRERMMEVKKIFSQSPKHLFTPEGLPTKAFMESPDFQKFLKTMQPKILGEADVTEVGNINLFLGESVGDKVLKEAYALTAKSYMDKGMVTFLTGGDEFVHFAYDHRVLKEFRTTYIKHVARIMNVQEKGLLISTQLAADVRKSTKKIAQEMDGYITKNYPGATPKVQLEKKRIYLEQVVKKEKIPTLDAMISDSAIVKDIRSKLQARAQEVAQATGLESTVLAQYFETEYLVAVQRSAYLKTHLGDALIAYKKIDPKKLNLTGELAYLEEAIVHMKKTSLTPR